VHRHVTYTLHDLTIHLPFFFNSNNISWQEQFMKLYTMQSWPISYYFQSLKSMGWSALLPNPVYSLSSMSQNKCQHTTIKILCKQTHVYTAIASFLKEEGEQNITKLQCAFLQIYFLSISSLSNPYCLIK